MNISENEERKWYHGNNGKLSALRIIVVPAGFLGMFVVLVSLYSFVVQGNPNSVLMAGVGAGMIATAEASKVWQKGKEG